MGSSLRTAIPDRRGRPWAQSAVWGALWLLSTGETPEWLAEHQPSRIRKHLRSMRPGDLLWAVRRRAELHRFRARAEVMHALVPYLVVSGAGAIGRKTEPARIEGYVTANRYRWMRDDFPIVPDRSGHLILRVSDFAAFLGERSMPGAFVATDMVDSDDPAHCEEGLLLLDDLLRDFGGAARHWLTVPELAAAITGELGRDDEVFAIRLLAKTLQDAAPLSDPADLVRFLQQPPTTGDRRWDVLLAAAAARQCRLWGVDPPSWTDVEGLETWWFPALVDTSLVLLTVQRTPPEFASRGIWLDERALVAA